MPLDPTDTSESIDAAMRDLAEKLDQACVQAAFKPQPTHGVRVSVTDSFVTEVVELTDAPRRSSRAERMPREKVSLVRERKASEVCVV